MCQSEFPAIKHRNHHRNPNGFIFYNGNCISFNGNYNGLCGPLQVMWWLLLLGCILANGNLMGIRPKTHYTFCTNLFMVYIVNSWWLIMLFAMKPIKLFFFLGSYYWLCFKNKCSSLLKNQISYKTH